MSNLKKVDIVALAKAVLIGFVASFVMGVATVFVGAGLAHTSGLTGDDIENSMILQGFIFCQVLLTYIICGYFAAMFAGRNELAYGVTAGIVLLAISELSYLILLTDDRPFTLLNITTLCLVVPFAACGAIIRKRTM